jgi:CoA:oxalate CoA-transferase
VARLLEGLLVADFTRVLAGPFAGMVLADLGARVIKIEPPGGDEARGFGPFVDGQSLYFTSVNRGKEGIALNLKEPDGVELARDLCRRADILLENFRPGTMARLGLGYDELAAANPRLIYASVSGFGHYGPNAGKGAYDVIIQAVSGLMSLTGPEGGPPVRVGASLGDLVPALYAVAGVLAALFARERTGRGAFLDIAMQDAVVSVVENAVARAWATGEDPQPLGSRHPAIAPFAAFPAADGDLALAAGNDALFVRLCEALEAPDLARNPLFLTNSSRVEHVAALTDELTRLLARRPVAEWLAILEGAGIPCGRVARISDLLADEHLKARRMILPLEQPGVGAVPVPGIPIKAAGFDDSLPGPAPAFGQHGPAVATELLGYSEATVARLLADGALLLAGASAA